MFSSGDIILQQVLHQYVTHPKSMTIITKISILKHLFFRHWNSYFANVACVCHFVVARIKETSTEDDRAVPNRITIQTHVANNRNWLGSSLHEIILSQCRNQYSGCKLLPYEVFFVLFIPIRYFESAESHSREKKNASQLKKNSLLNYDKINSKTDKLENARKKNCVF